MNDIGPGTPLVFIGPDSALWPSGLTIDALYFVKEVIPASPIRVLMRCQDMVSLRGDPGFHKSYCLCAFKPLGEGEPPAEETSDDTPIKVPEHA